MSDAPGPVSAAQHLDAVYRAASDMLNSIHTAQRAHELAYALARVLPTYPVLDRAAVLLQSRTTLPASPTFGSREQWRDVHVEVAEADATQRVLIASPADGSAIELYERAHTSIATAPRRQATTPTPATLDAQQWLKALQQVHDRVLEPIDRSVLPAGVTPQQVGAATAELAYTMVRAEAWDQHPDPAAVASSAVWEASTGQLAQTLFDRAAIVTTVVVEDHRDLHGDGLPRPSMSRVLDADRAGTRSGHSLDFDHTPTQTPSPTSTDFGIN